MSRYGFVICGNGGVTWNVVVYGAGGVWLNVVSVECSSDKLSFGKVGQSPV